MAVLNMHLLHNQFKEGLEYDWAIKEHFATHFVNHFFGHVAAIDFIHWPSLCIPLPSNFT